jgi:hypothetical protein
LLDAQAAISAPLNKKRKASVFTPVKEPQKRQALVETLRLNAAPAVAKPQLRLKKTTAKKLDFKPLPYVAHNDMYDDNWADKQERAFTQWINYEFNAGADASLRSPANADGSSLRQFSASLAYEGAFLCCDTN